MLPPLVAVAPVACPVAESPATLDASGHETHVPWRLVASEALVCSGWVSVPVVARIGPSLGSAGSPS